MSLESQYRAIRVVARLRKMATNYVKMKALNKQLTKQYLDVDESNLCKIAAKAADDGIANLTKLKKDLELFIDNINKSKNK